MIRRPLLLSLATLVLPLAATATAAGVGVGTGPAGARPRVIVTSDAEIDDQCSLVRFLLYANEWDIEGIITTSSQYRWQGHKWPGDDWIQPYLAAYAEVHPNLIRHDPAYPSPAQLRALAVMGNAAAEGDLAAPSPGSELIVRALLDRSDPRPIWLQAWGGVNTIARALKTIEEQHPERMAEVAAKCRLFLIWEQDDTYQSYIRPVWGKYGILTIISDQFEAIAYRWKQTQPESLHRYFDGAWMRANILRDRGPLTALYHAHENGDFRSEGDSPAFLHTIPTGLRSLESPDWGGWGGRYVRIRENTWLDPVDVPNYVYPAGRWWGENGWGRASLRPGSTSTPEQRARYFAGMTRWSAAMQNDFAARAAWCVLSYEEANHPPIVALAHPADLTAAPGATVALSARGTRDPDGDALTYHWWRDAEADTARGEDGLGEGRGQEATLVIPSTALPGQTVHAIVEVTDQGTPALTRYQRVVVTVVAPAAAASSEPSAAVPVPVPPAAARFPFEVVSADLLPHGDPALAVTAGIEGRAIRLDGRAARGIIPTSAVVDSGEESFSLAFWFRWPRGLQPDRQVILTKGDSLARASAETGRGYELAIDRGELVFALNDGRTAAQLRVDPLPFLTGDWVHVVAVRDRAASRLRLYANGRLQPTSNPGNPGGDGTDRTGGLANARPLMLGGSIREESSLPADFDELHVYRAALTDAQAWALATRVPTVEVTEAVAPVRAAPPGAPLASLPSPLLHLPLTEGDGLTLTDRVAGLRAQLQAADAHGAWTSSDRGLALRLDGVDDLVELSPGRTLAGIEESFAVALHVRPTAAPRSAEASVLIQGESSPGNGWEIRWSSADLVFAWSKGQTTAALRVASEHLPAGQWSHLVAVRNAQEQQLELYVNGVRLLPLRPDEPALAGRDPGGAFAPLQTLTIGAARGGARAFAGEFADVRLYRGTLTAAQAVSVASLRRNAASNPAETGRATP